MENVSKSDQKSYQTENSADFTFLKATVILYLGFDNFYESPDFECIGITEKENIVKEFHLNQVYQKANGQKKND